jgi:hypothetical protein
MNAIHASLNGWEILLILALALALLAISKSAGPRTGHARRFRHRKIRQRGPITNPDSGQRVGFR